ncbi:MAG: TerC family protein [Acidimicrobiia bacterium]
MSLLAASKSSESQLYHVPIWVWATVLSVVVIALLLDLFVFNRKAHEISMKEAAIASVAWIALGIAFGIFVIIDLGGKAGGEYFAAYILEKSLSVDNLFVFALLFSFFAVPKIYQHRVLFWGVVGALVLRGIFIAAGSALITRFEFVLAIFGLILLYSAFKMAFTSHDAVDPNKNKVLIFMRKRMKMTRDYHGQKFFVKIDAKKYATPLFAVLVIVETTDVIFALDSIPAVFGISRDPFIVFASNAFAILGLRALYFLVSGLLDRFSALKYGLSFILAFIGVKLMAGYFLSWHAPIWLSLGVIAASLAVSIIYSLALPVKEVEETKEPGAGLVELDEEFKDPDGAENQAGS